MTELPDTCWDIDYRKTSQECIDAKAQAAGRPSPLMLPAAGVEATALGIKRPLWTKKSIPTVEMKEEEAGVNALKGRLRRLEERRGEGR